MKGDYSRDTFSPAKHFTQVLMQQGRVQLDADWNEQGAILLHYLRRLATDLIGSYGGPADQTGFEIRPLSPNNDQTKLKDLSIGFGRYYVDGILCENLDHSAQGRQLVWVASNVMEATRAVHGRTTGHSQTYRHQTDYPPDPLREDPEKALEAPLFVYLDVWERHITAVEDYNIREAALGGPDTAARTQLVWQVKIVEKIAEDFQEGTNCAEFDQGEDGWTKIKRLLLQPGERAMLRARAFVPDDSKDVCIVSPESHYRGAENQLYRVEIHKGGTAKDVPTFKWSRENGSVTYRIQSVTENTVVLESLGRDARFGLEVGDWVEVVDDDYTRLGKADPLLRVDVIEPNDMRVTLNAAPLGRVGHNQKKHPFLRRWDQRQGDAKTGGLTLSEGAANIIERTKNNSHWLNLEDGVQVQFEPGGTYRHGDFWLIPARTATGDVEWPGPPVNPDPMPPKGVEHHYAPLAIVFKRGEPEYFTVIDLRHKIEPVSKCVCPRVQVINPPTSSGATIQFSADVGVSETELGHLKFKWTLDTTNQATLSGGALSDRTIIVKPKPNVKEITPQVEVTGLPDGCSNIATGMCEIKAP